MSASTSPLDAATVRRRFLLLRALRWLPTGLLVPVVVLVMTGRGFTLGQIGLAGAAQGALVLLLELPTGGLADALGRRPVLVAATLVEAAAVLVLALWADTLALLALVWALQGVYRALESGPLDAWFVDAILAADPDADVEAGLAGGGAVLGTAIAVGSVASSALVAVAPGTGVTRLVLPLLVAVGLRGVEVACLWRLMAEVRPPVGLAALRASLRAVPRVVREAVGVVRASHALLALVAVELFWGAGMATWEVLLPARLEQVLAGPDAAAALLGPLSAAAWGASAVAAGLVPRLSRRLGPHVAGAALRVAQAATVLVMGLAGGAVGIAVGYLLTYGVHGASNPVHHGLLHREVGAGHRTTVLSVNSMVGLPAAALGTIALGALADATSIPVAMVAGAALLAAAAPLYLLARPGRGLTARSAASG